MSLMYLFRWFSAVVFILASLGRASIRAEGQEQHPPIRVERFTIEGRWDIVDWDWRGSLIVLSQPSDKSRQITIWKISETVQVDKGKPFVDADFPVILKDDGFAYIENNNRLVIASLDTRKVVESLALGQIGIIGEVTVATGALWMYSIDAHVPKPDATMFMVAFNPLRVCKLGTGYYPRTFDGLTVYFVDHRKSFSLYAVSLGEHCELAGGLRLILGSNVYGPRVLPGTDLLVCQRGFEVPRIELINKDEETC